MHSVWRLPRHALVAAIITMAGVTTVGIVLLVLTFGFGIDLSLQKDTTSIDWQTLDLIEEPLRYVRHKTLVDIKDDLIKDCLIKDFGKNLKVDEHITYKECVPDGDLTRPSTGKTVLLLHGGGHSADDWVKAPTPTMQYLCYYGIRAVAVNINLGYGNTPGNASELLSQIVSEITGEVKPVIVAPAFSQALTLPFLVDSQDRVGGVVLVDGCVVPNIPYGKEEYDDFLENTMEVPTLITYGDKDPWCAESASRLEVIATSTTVVFKRTKDRFQVYREDPDLWHQILINFVNLI